MSSLRGPSIAGKRARSAAMISRVSSTDSVVWVTKASRSGSLHLERGDVLDRSPPGRCRPPPAAVALAHGAFDLGVARHGRSARRRCPLAQWRATSICTLVTSGQVASNTAGRARAASSRTACETPCALKITVAPSGTSASSSTNTAPRGAQVFHHVAVVHDLVAHVDRRAERLQRALDDLDGAVDAGAETAGIGQQDLHQTRAPESAFAAPLSAITSTTAPSRCRNRRC